MKRPLGANVQVDRFFRMLFPALAILVVGILVVLSFLVYKVSHPGAAPGSMNPSYTPLPYLEIPIATRDGKELNGWWIPGLKGAPGIILAPGYGMNRADALSLATALHETGFNLLIFSQRGSGADPKGSSSLGLYEPGDMMEALHLLQGRSESNRDRIGIWGVDVGALGALRAAAECPQVRAIVADGAFETVSDFLNYKMEEDFGLDNRIVQLGSLQIFRLAHFQKPV
jgi:pimeloyl-ACP methyl ester carboxylesterase